MFSSDPFTPIEAEVENVFCSLPLERGGWFRWGGRGGVFIPFRLQSIKGGKKSQMLLKGGAKLQGSRESVGG